MSSSSRSSSSSSLHTAADAAAVRPGPSGLHCRHAHHAGLQLLEHALRRGRRLVRDHEQALLVVAGADVALPLSGAAAWADDEGAAEAVCVLEAGVCACFF